MMKVDLTPWETEQLINMSREYCAMISIAKDPQEPNPWRADDYSELQEAREKVFRNGMKISKKMEEINKAL